jgi:hypothetical protein
MQKKGKGDIRDVATLEQLVVLSNMKNVNALLIRQGLSQGERAAEQRCHYANEVALGNPNPV